MRFRSGFDFVAQLPPFSEEVIREEPNLFSARPEDVEARGGPIARTFLAMLPEAFRARPFRMRSKLQWLKEGWRTGSGPGGYHCDQVGFRSDGDQDHVHRSQPGRHTIGAAVGDIARTRFAVGEYELPDYAVGKKQALLWHCHLTDAVARGEMTEVIVPDGGMLQFGQHDFHTTGVAQRTGWRLFIRATHLPEGVAELPDRDLDAWNRVSNLYAPETIAQAALFAAYAGY